MIPHEGVKKKALCMNESQGDKGLKLFDAYELLENEKDQDKLNLIKMK